MNEPPPSGARRRELAAEHTPERVAARLRAAKKPRYLADAVLGGVDGCITTFAIVAAAHGAELGSTVILVLGLASLIADGFSMAVSNFQSAAIDRDHHERLHREELEQIEHVPEGEREEIRQIYAGKGLSGEALDAVVDALTSDQQTWVSTMLSEEHGLAHTSANPLLAALSTFTAFIVVGALPLVPFLIASASVDAAFRAALIVAGLSFFGIGMVRAKAANAPLLRGGLGVLAIGGVAALLAWSVAHFAQAL